jgi:very-short-patch-repair endonuclease
MEGRPMPHADIPDRHRQNAKAMRREMTDAERKLWNELRAHRLMGLGFRRQVPIAGYIVDFACTDHRLVVEVDWVPAWEGLQCRLRCRTHIPIAGRRLDCLAVLE